MKMKIYTLATLCLFFFTKISAQNVDAVSSIDNEIDLTLLVEDAPLGQEFRLLAEDYHDVFHEIDYINYNISLNYKSTQNVTSYFALRCHFEEILFVNPTNTDDPLKTATAPVIIPPVKKKKKEPRQVSEGYPHLAKIIYRIHPRVYQVKIELLKYKTYDDYILENDNYTVRTTKLISINAKHDIPSNSEVSMVTYPNPSIDHLTIELINTTTENLPLEVVIFNDKGVQVSQHTLVNSSTETNSSLYNLDTSHLQNGTYYVQLSHGGKTQVKTIIKE